MSFDISAEARADTANTIRFYNSKPDRHGSAFRAEFGRAVAAIVEMPRMYPLVADGVPDREIREYHIERFQQRVIYLITGDDVLVVAIVHASRREGSWHGNLPTEPAN